MIGYGTRTNEFVHQVEKWQQNKSAIQVRNGMWNTTMMLTESNQGGKATNKGLVK